MIKYQEKQIKINNLLSFWKHFENEERFLFYNPQQKEFILGAKHLKTFPMNEGSRDYLYAFSSMTFFDTVKDEKWVGFGNETIAFEYYLVEKDGKQTLYYYKDSVEIESTEVESCKHSFRVPTSDYGDWKQLFSVVKNEITRHELNKVVISREVKIEFDTLINIESILHNLLEQNKNSFVFAYFKEGKTFLGATPEILVQKEKNNITSYALAGTISRSGKNDELQKEILLNDAKNRYEHQIVIDSIVDVMGKFTHDLTIGETTIMTLNKLFHLQTRIHAKDENSSLFEWVKRLHPTPALGGSPVKKALELIRKYEKHERGLYGAPIGVTDRNGDGVFLAGIRCALIYQNAAFAYTGCGIVDKSDCETEYVETRNKLKTIIDSL